MLTTAPIIAFVATVKPGQALTFYRDVLGLKLNADTPFALEFTAGGVDLRVAKVPTLAPAPYTVLGWVVADIAAAVTALTYKNVAFERFPGMAQDAQGVWASPSGARVAWFKDPDGNLLSLTQNAA